MDIFEKIASVCAAHIESFDIEVEEEMRDGFPHVVVKLGSEQYTITVEDADVQVNERGNGATLSPGRSFVQIIDADTCSGDLLDACLDAIAQDRELQPLVGDLTSDGDEEDCEAIFELTGHGYVALKVR